MPIKTIDARRIYNNAYPALGRALADEKALPVIGILDRIVNGLGAS
jgi:hypothetical protein